MLSLQGASSPGGRNQAHWRLSAPRGHAVKICPSRWVGAVGISRGQQGRPGAQVSGHSRAQEEHSKARLERRSV